MTSHIQGVGVENNIFQTTIDPLRLFTPPLPAKTGYMDVISSEGKARIHYTNFNITGISYFK
jgi:hypothetical protein